MTVKQMHNITIQLCRETACSGSGGQVTDEYQRGWKAAARCIARTLRTSDDYQPLVDVNKN